MEEMAKIRALLNDRSGSCGCRDCEERLDRFTEEQGPYDCDLCGYKGRPATIECACYEFHCRPQARGAGCPHGSVVCPVCDEGERDPWEIIRAIRAIVEG